MGENTAIEWAHHTFNAWIGCTKVGPGCDHCYAERANRRFHDAVNWGPGAPRRRTTGNNWTQPLRWNLRAEREGTRYRVFANSWSDVLDNEVPDDWRHDFFRLVDLTPNLDWLLVTKRIGNASGMLPPRVAGGSTRLLPWSHVWLIATVCNQAELDRDLPKLQALKWRVGYIGLSIGPMLGRVLLPRDHQLDWVICEGESNDRAGDARAAIPEHVRNLRDQCTFLGIPFFFKQWGQWMPLGAHLNYDQAIAHATAHRLPYQCLSNGEVIVRVGKADAGRMLDGRTWDQLPGDPH